MKGAIDGGKLTITFTRNSAAIDFALAVTETDDLAGVWTAIARSSNGVPYSAISPGATESETGSGSSKNVVVTDSFLITDPGHPRRIIRHEVRR